MYSRIMIQTTPGDLEKSFNKRKQYVTAFKGSKYETWEVIPRTVITVGGGEATAIPQQHSRYESQLFVWYKRAAVLEILIRIIRVSS